MPDAAQPDAAQPDAAQPDAAQPGAPPAAMEALRGERLEALLDAVSDAPDFAEAARRLTRGVAARSARRARACTC
jgi:hypothetical protein